MLLASNQRLSEVELAIIGGELGGRLVLEGDINGARNIFYLFNGVLKDGAEEILARNGLRKLEISGKIGLFDDVYLESLSRDQHVKYAD